MLRTASLTVLALLLLMVAVAPGTAADPVGCTMDLASGEYYSFGAYFFDHGQIKVFAGESVDHAVVYFYCLSFY